MTQFAVTCRTYDTAKENSFLKENRNNKRILNKFIERLRLRYTADNKYCEAKTRDKAKNKKSKTSEKKNWKKMKLYQIEQDFRLYILDCRC